MLKFVPDNLKTNNMHRHAGKKLPYLSRYFPDQYKSHQVCHKAILENIGTLNCLPHC